MNDPMEQTRKLRDRLEQECAKIGLSLVGFALVPGTDGIPDHAQAVFEVDVEEVVKDDSERDEEVEVLKFRAELNAMEEETRQESLQESMRKMIERGGGFLGTPDE